MGWLKRIFGQDKPEKAQSRRVLKSTPTKTASAARPSPTGTGKTIPPERVGLNGEYDQSGLAKRVTLAYDEDPDLDDIETVWVAQTASTVVLKGKVPSQELLNKMIKLAKEVDGTTAVDTEQVEVS
jgi:hypothetical protein